MSAATKAAIKGVENHPRHTCLSVLILITWSPFMALIPSTAPTIAWEEETGTPITAKI